MKDIVLAIRELSVLIQKDSKVLHLIKNISLDIEKGSITALLGESGAGKSLLASCIMGLLPMPPFLPPTGKIIYQEKNLLESPAELQKVRGRKIALIFQEPKSALNPVFTIGDQLLECKSLPTDQREARERIFRALEEVRLPDPKKVMHSYPHELSGGMLQRVLIAMALLGEPDLLIADEPTTALDVTIQAQILELLSGLQEKRGLSILLITHDLGVVAEIADRVCILFGGEIMEEGRAHDLFDGHLHPYTTALFDARYFSPKLARFNLNESNFYSGKGCLFQARCPHVMPLCKEKEPPLFSLLKEGHKAACFLYDPTLEKHLSYEEENS